LALQQRQCRQVCDGPTSERSSRCSNSWAPFPGDSAKAAGLSQPTAGKIITELEELGLLQQAGSMDGNDAGHGSDMAARLGRSRQFVQLDSPQARFLAIELGFEKTCIAALPVAAKLTDEWALTFPTPKSPDARRFVVLPG
jgi:hypothetical protein